MSRDARPLVGVIAGSGIDGESWLRTTALPTTHVWQMVEPLNVPRQVSWLVWLWNADATAEQQRQDHHTLVRSLGQLLRQRGNRLVPIVFVASPSQSLEGDTWRAEVQRHLRRFYTRHLRKVAPRALTEIDRITLLDGGGHTGERLAERGDSLVTLVLRWRGQLRREAGQCLQAALAFTVVYVLLLLASFPWSPSASGKAEKRPLLDWTWSEWRQHLDACRDLLNRIEGKHWRALDPDTRAAFSQYLRWLPVSHDLLQQRDSSQQSARYLAEIESLLDRMEYQVKQWTGLRLDSISPPPLRLWLTLSPTWADYLRRGFTQNLREELLDHVFDPRPGASELHRLADQFWLDDRAYTQSLLRLTTAKATTPIEQLDRLVRVLQDRLKVRQATRVHAPHRKLAILQELEQALAWALKRQQSQNGVTPADLRQPNTPAFIREAFGSER